MDAGGFTKISHDDDFSAFGLPNFPPENVLWYNADYPLYVLRRALPEATHYAMVEYDVAVNVDVPTILRDARQRNLDLIAHHIRIADPSWGWSKTIDKDFDQPMRAFIPFLVISARAIDVLLAARLEIAQGRALTEQDDWPFCEGFIASVLAKNGMQMAELVNYADLTNFGHAGHRNVQDPAVSQFGTICHPVVEPESFIRRRLAEATPGMIFDPDSALLQELYFCEPADFMGELIDG